MVRDILRRYLAAGGLLLISAGAVGGVYEDMVHAVNNDDERAVIELLRKGVDVNTVGPNGDSLLMLAARHGKPEMVKAVLGARPRIDARNAYGETALMLAAFHGHTEVVRELLARGALVNHPGWNPLIYAAAENRLGVARLLIGRGAEVNAETENGTTVLMMAARGGHLQMLLLLLEHGADPNRKSRDGVTALSHARVQEHRDLVEVLERIGAAE